MLTMTFLVKTLIDLYVMVLLLRIWMQWSRCDFYNPLAQFVVKITQPIVKPLRRILPALGPIDTASLLLAFVLTTLKYPLLLLIQVGVFSVDPANLLVGLLSLLKSAGYLVFWVIIIRSLMSWISQGPRSDGLCADSADRAVNGADSPHSARDGRHRLLRHDRHSGAVCPEFPRHGPVPGSLVFAVNEPNWNCYAKSCSCHR